MKILTFTGFYLPGYKGGGPIKTIKNLVEQTGDEISFKIITSDRDLGDAVPYTTIDRGSWNKVGKAEVFYTKPSTSGYIQVVKILNKKNYDIVYLNSFFSTRYSFFPLLIAKALKQKIVLAPRGEFSEGAMSLKAQKKFMFIKLYKSLRLHRGTIFQASSDYEAEDIRKLLGSSVDIQIAENISAKEFIGVLPVRNIRTLNMVFVSRISPMKNLLTALEILKTVKQLVNYEIYGPIEDCEYWSECEAVIEALPTNIQVEYKGELYPDDVLSTLSKYDALFIPTKGENYGHVIAEGLCAGLPLLIADTTPWRNLKEQRIGWDLSLNNPDSFIAAIDELALMSPDKHHQMRENVLKWAKNKFSQRDAIDANVAMFKYASNN